MEQVLGYTRPLCLPVKPEPSGAVMEMVAADDDVNGCVHLDAADLSACKVLFVVDMVDVVVLNDGEHPSQMPDDPGLAAIVDIAPAHDVGADVFLCPAFPLCLADSVPFGLRAVFI